MNSILDNLKTILAVSGALVAVGIWLGMLQAKVNNLKPDAIAAAQAQALEEIARARSTQGEASPGMLVPGASTYKFFETKDRKETRRYNKKIRASVEENRFAVTTPVLLIVSAYSEANHKKTEGDSLAYSHTITNISINGDQCSRDKSGVKGVEESAWLMSAASCLQELSQGDHEVRVESIYSPDNFESPLLKVRYAFLGQGAGAVELIE